MSLATVDRHRHNDLVRIDLRNLARKRLFRAKVDPNRPPTVVHGPPDSPYAGQEVYLNWDQALGDEAHLRRCPACGCRELFVRKDFPQVTGFVIILMAAVIAIALFAAKQVKWAIALLATIAGLDTLIYFFAGKCLVCYRCRSEFRDLPIRHDHPGWDLAVGEKYRLSQRGDADDEPTNHNGAEGSPSG